jgi:hypothetical protein
MREGKAENNGQDPFTHSGDISLMSRNKYVIEKAGGSFSRKELYEVKDEEGNTLCFAERQGELYKTVAVACFLFSLIFPLVVIGNLDANPPAWNFIALSIYAIALIPFVVVLLRPRNLFVYGSGVDRNEILRLIHRRVYRPFVGAYMIESPTGELLGYLKRNRPLRNIFRAHMKCYSPDGALICTISEDVELWYWILSISDNRLIVKLTIVEPTEGRVIGKSNGKTIELAPEARLDGRICLAMGLMICAEMRVT